MLPREFTERLYVMQSSPSHSEYIDFIFNEMDDALTAGNFEWVDKVLEIMDVDKVDLKSSISMLTVSRPREEDESKLPSYKTFFERVEQKLKGLNRHPLLLKGLEP